MPHISSNPKQERLIQSLQLDESLRHFKYLLYFILTIVTVLLALSAYNPIIFINPTIRVWGWVTIFLLIIGIVLSHTLLLEKKVSLIFKKIFLYIAISICGVFITLGTLALNLPVLTEQGNMSLILIVTYSIIIHIGAMLTLSYYFRFFLCFVLTALLPSLIIHFSQFDQLQNSMSSIAAYAYSAIILMMGYLLSLSRLTALSNQIDNKILIEQAQQTQNQLQYLYRSLDEEKQLAETMKQELQQHNNMLEEKVLERTFDIERINARLERSYQNLEMAHETAGIASWDWDIHNRLIDTSNFLPLFGYSIKNMDHYIHHLSDFIHADDIAHVKQEMRRHLRGFSHRYEAIYRVFHQTEQWIWVHDMGRVVQRDHKNRKPLRMVGIRRNINNEKKAEERLKLSASVFKKAAQGIFVLDNKLNYIDANPYYLNLLALNEKQILGHHVFDVAKSHKPETHQLHLTILHQLMSNGEFEGEIIEELADGTEVPLWIHINAIYDAQNKVSQYIGIATDLTERKTSEKRLSYLQTYDALTDLPNRYYFNNILHGHLTNSLKQLSKFAIIRINLDRFRYYNELLNHQGGDELLKQVASRLRQANANAVVVARLNADDFSVILDSTYDNSHAIAHCKKLIDAFSQPFKINGQEFIMTISIGVAIFPEHGRQMDSLNNHAELALLEAKRIGGNAIRIYHNEDRLSSATRVSLESELRRAIQNKELVVYYQPKLNAQQHSIDCFEALVRWDHPEHGIIPPAQFIPLAEETSLISDIGKLVLEMACAQIKSWVDLGFKNISVSVNIVAQQIQRGHLIEEIDFALKKYAISSRQLELEITETSIMENTDDVKNFMRQLRQRNIKVSLDDFGTGYSSLAYLAQYSFDIIKIDRSFISKIGTSNQDAIVRAIIAMTKAMGKKVVAEGVETTQHYDFLLQEGCDYLQGYLIGKPMPAEQATKFLANYKQTPFFNTPA